MFRPSAIGVSAGVFITGVLTLVPSDSIGAA
jgi:hypothetical protein